VTSPTRRQGISRLIVEGYKSLRARHTVDIRPLTILAGVNSSGKSSVMQPLLLLKQTIESTYDPGPLLLNGPNVSVTAIDQILSRGPSARSQVRSFTVGLGIGGEETTIRFGKDKDNDLRILEFAGYYAPDQDQPIPLREDMSEEELLRSLTPSTAELYEGLVSGNRPERRLSVDRDRFILYPAVSLQRLPGTSINLGFRNDSLRRDISQVIHLPALRGNPKRTYPVTAVEQQYPGTFDVYTAGVIASWRNRQKVDLLNFLKSDLERLSLTWKVEARRVLDTQVELLVGRLPHAQQGGARDLVNIADVGFGVSQTLPVVVALLAADPGQLVYLEQPEIHLHPRAQVRFGSLIPRALARGVITVIETHSSLLIQSVQTLVAKGEINPKDVVLHWCARDPITGFTKITTAELKDDGSFGDWPEDFDEVQLAAEAEYLDAASAKDRRRR